jgi:hypothetical protein
MSLIPATGNVEGGTFLARDNPGQKLKTPSEKQVKYKGVRVGVHMVKHILMKPEGLGSNPRTSKNKTQ